MIFLILWGCGEKDPTFTGKHKNLIYESNLKKNYLEEWQGIEPIALHSHTAIQVKETTWMKNLRENNDNKNRNALAKEFGVEDLNTTISNITKKGFSFSTPLDIIAQEKSEYSPDHLGSIVVTSSQEGTFPVEAKGFDADQLDLRFAKIHSWKLISLAYSSLENQSIIALNDFCISPEQPLHFIFQLYNQEEEALAWNFPSWNITASSPKISITNAPKSLSLTAQEGFNQAQLTFSAQNVFGEKLTSDSLNINLCETKPSDIKKITITATSTDDQPTSDHANLDEAGLAILTKLKKENTPIGNPSFWENMEKNGGYYMYKVNIDVESDKHHVFAAEASIEKGIILDAFTLLQLIFDKDEDLVRYMLGQKNIEHVVSTGSFVVMVPDKNEHMVTLTYGSHKVTATIPAIE